jgi:hypothetical protein
MPYSTTLGTLKIGKEPITIELIEESDALPLVRVTWPRGGLSTNARKFPEIAASLTRLFSSASIELARIKSGDRLDHPPSP